ncbi:MAG: efflux RND transporter permease subunit [Thiolinea sp.]
MTGVQGMSVLHATVYAARRRVIPILITTMTTIAGLFSLATGLGGKSLIWGPVATAIVWGVGFSTLLTLFAVPVLYRLANRKRRKRRWWGRKKPVETT